MAFLEQTIDFYRAAAKHFEEHGIRHVQKLRKGRLRASARGTPLEVGVYLRGGFDLFPA